MLRIASLLVFAILIIHPKFSWADSFDYGKWSYNCMHDHTDPYGRVQNPRNCWAIICGDEGLGLRSCLSIFKFDERGEGLASIDSTEACEFTPSENAVDGKRIDLLPQNEQVKAVVSGNFITR